MCVAIKTRDEIKVTRIKIKIIHIYFKHIFISIRIGNIMFSFSAKMATLQDLKVESECSKKKRYSYNIFSYCYLGGLYLGIFL